MGEEVRSFSTPKSTRAGSDVIGHLSSDLSELIARVFASHHCFVSPRFLMRQSQSEVSFLDGSMKGLSALRVHQPAVHCTLCMLYAVPLAAVLVEPCTAVEPPGSNGP
eukprot:SAG25_NODE_8553_length_416_cov_0.817035_1_plen_107_part_01